MILHNIFIQVLFQLSYTVFLLSAIQRLFFGLFIVTVTWKCFATAVNCSQRMTINCLNFPKWQKLTSLFTYIYYTGKSIEAHLLIFDFVLFQSHSHRYMKSTTLQYERMSGPKELTDSQRGVVFGATIATKQFSRVLPF